MEIKTTLTQTKAGRRFMGFMRAFNMGDAEMLRQNIEQYIADEALAAHPAEAWLAQLQRIYMDTGGLRALQVLGQEEYRVVVLMAAHRDQSIHLIEMAVSEDYPHKITRFSQRVS